MSYNLNNFDNSNNLNNSVNLDNLDSSDNLDDLLFLIPDTTKDFKSFSEDFSRKSKLISGLNLTSDRFMSKVLEDKLACQELINIILDRNDIIVDDVITQYNIPNTNNHGVRLDVMCHDTHGNIYEIEIQNLNKGTVYDTRRTRYIQGSIDTSTLAISDNYSNLPDLHIIFIASYDPIGDGKPIYHIQRIVEETGKTLDNGVHEIYLNLKELSDKEDLRELQEFFLNSKPNHKTNFFPALAKRITDIKSPEGGKEDMCEVFDKLEMMYEKVGYEKGHEKGREAGREEGRAEGHKEGREEERTNSIVCLIESLHELGISKEDTISKLKTKFNINDEQISEYMNKYWCA